MTHATYVAYRAGCRCQPCVTSHQDYARVRKHPVRMCEPSAIEAIREMRRIIRQATRGTK